MKFKTTKITTFKLTSSPNRKISIHEYFDLKVIHLCTPSLKERFLFSIHYDKTMTCMGVRNNGS